MNNDKYISTQKAKQILGVTTATLRNWDKQGKIRSITAPSGVHLYHSKDISYYTGRNGYLTKNAKICYCRVSSRKQADDLERQKDFYRSKFPHYELVEDIGSGINWERKGFRTLLERCMSGEVEEVVVAHRDRLCRFAFDLVKFILETSGVKLTVLDSENEQSSEKELCKDILSIIHVYSCRDMGKRRYTSKKDKVLSKSKTEKNP